MDLKAATSHKDQTISSNCGDCLTLWKGNVDPDKEAGEVSMNSVNVPECALKNQLSDLQHSIYLHQFCVDSLHIIRI